MRKISLKNESYYITQILITLYKIFEYLLVTFFKVKFLNILPPGSFIMQIHADLVPDHCND